MCDDTLISLSRADNATWSPMRDRGRTECIFKWGFNDLGLAFVSQFLTLLTEKISCDCQGYVEDLQHIVENSPRALQPTRVKSLLAELIESGTIGSEVVLFGAVA